MVKIDTFFFLDLWYTIKKGVLCGSLAFMQHFKFVNWWFRFFMSRTGWYNLQEAIWLRMVETIVKRNSEFVFKSGEQLIYLFRRKFTFLTKWNGTYRMCVAYSSNIFTRCTIFHGQGSLIYNLTSSLKIFKIYYRI